MRTASCIKLTALCGALLLAGQSQAQELGPLSVTSKRTTCSASIDRAGGWSIHGTCNTGHAFRTALSPIQPCELEVCLANASGPAFDTMIKWTMERGGRASGFIWIAGTEVDGAAFTAPVAMR